MDPKELERIMSELNSIAQAILKEMSNVEQRPAPTPLPSTELDLIISKAVNDIIEKTVPISKGKRRYRMNEYSPETLEELK